MRRLIQIFVAPGIEEEPLSLENSPWHIGHRVAIPKEHWDIVLDFAGTLNPEKMKILKSYSWSKDKGQGDDRIYASVEELRGILVFLEQLTQELEVADPLVPEVTSEILENYSNEEYGRMLRAVAATLRESIKFEQPFRAWVE